MVLSLIGAGIAGLSGSPHCVGMCGGFATAAARDPRHAVGYHGGRLITYATLGAIAGTFGAILPGPAWVPTVIAVVLMVWFSARLAGIAPEVHLPWAGALGAVGRRLVGASGLRGAVGLGLATALLPCGLVYAALAFPVAVAHPGWGAASMVAFGLGTTPLLAAASVGAQRLLAGSPWRRRALAALVLASGLWVTGQRASISAAPVVDGAPPSCHSVGGE